MNLKAVLEGLLFVTGEDGLTFGQAKDILDISSDDLIELIKDLQNLYLNEDRGIRLDILGDHLKLTTKKEHKQYYQALLDHDDNPLSQAALETLAIVAYNEPVTRVQVDEIRGISSSHMIRKLVAKDLVKELGRSELPGRPLLYGVTDQFLDYFGLASTAELPTIELPKEEDKETDLFESKYKED